MLVYGASMDFKSIEDVIWNGCMSFVLWNLVVGLLGGECFPVWLGTSPTREGYPI